jgi:molecular chaperone GrpE
MTEPNDGATPTPNDTPLTTPTETDTPASSGMPASEPAPAASAEEAALQQQLSQLKDLLLRRSAEFENYKRRVEQELLTTIRMANEGLVLAILPIMDDLERSLKAGTSSNDPTAFYRGVELIAQKLLKVLESQGVRAFESNGQPFDVHRHDALLQVPKADVPPHTIIEEVERGYEMHDKVIRHAKVVVSAAPPNPSEET